LPNVKVQILGNEYLLSSGAGEAQVRRVAAHLNARIEEVLSAGNPSSTLAAVVLAALNLTNELLQLKDRHERIYKEIEDSSERLLDKISEQSK
jgi:cell division protein ZapA (FtsZ GTPase activity inhibitor)